MRFAGVPRALNAGPTARAGLGHPSSRHAGAIDHTGKPIPYALSVAGPRSITHASPSALEVEHSWAARRDQVQPVGYLAKFFALTSLPYKDPGPDARVWWRRNGPLLLTVTPGMRLGPNDEPVSIGCPFGAMPRLLVAWMSTQAVLTQSPEIYPGNSLRGFLAELGQKATGGKNGTITRLREQTNRLLSATLEVKLEGDANRDAGKKLLVASEWDLDWHNSNKDRPLHPRSRIRLSPEFYEELIQNPVPLDLLIMQALDSPAAMDLYTWLVYALKDLEGQLLVPWTALRDQLGFQLAHNPAGMHQLRTSVIKYLGRVREVYPEANVTPTKEGLLLTPSRPISVRRTCNLLKA